MSVSIAVLSIALAAQGQRHPCDALECALAARCVVWADGSAHCEDFETLSGNSSSNSTAGDPCVALACEQDSFCARNATGAARCVKREANSTHSFRTNSTAEAACAALNCVEQSTCSFSASGVAYCESAAVRSRDNETVDSLLVSTQACRGVVCPPKTECHVGDSGTAYCVRLIRCDEKICPAGTRCVEGHVAGSSGAFCGPFETVSGTRLNGTAGDTDELQWCMHVSQRSDVERKSCCKFGFGCPANPYDCAGAADTWDAAHSSFCCQATREGRGCKEPCPAARAAQEDASGDCCETRGACGTDYFKRQRAADDAARAKRGFVGTQLWVKLDAELVAGEDVLASPKAVLRRVRLRLLAASEELRKDPSRLLVTTIGVLQEGEVPSAASETALVVPVPEKWNRALLAEETALIDGNWVTSARRPRALADTSQEAYAAYTVEGMDADSVRRVAASVGGQSSDSPVHANLGLVVGVALGGLCLGGLVALTMQERSPVPTAGALSDVLDHAEALQQPVGTAGQYVVNV